MPQPIECPVRLESNGRYWKAVWAGTAGQAISKGLGAKRDVTRRAALARCQALAVEFHVAPEARDRTRSPRLSEWLAEYIGLRTDLSDGSLTILRCTVGHMLTFFSADPTIDQIGPAEADAWAAWLRVQPSRQRPPHPISKSTVSLYLRSAKTIFAWAVKHRKRTGLGINPFSVIDVSAPKPSGQWADITRDDLERILEACPSQGWRCVFALARLAGLRRGEALRLTWDNINWKTRLISVVPPGDHEDTKHNRREVPICPRLMEVLREAFEAAPEGQALVATLSYGGRNINRDAPVIIRRAGLCRYAKPFHTLRKCLETEWLDQHPAMTVCKWLGHSPTVAAAHYHRATPQAVAAVTGAGNAAGTEAELRAQVAELRALLAATAATA